jgi:hypothetical protein
MPDAVDKETDFYHYGGFAFGKKVNPDFLLTSISAGCTEVVTHIIPAVIDTITNPIEAERRDLPRVHMIEGVVDESARLADLLCYPRGVDYSKTIDRQTVARHLFPDTQTIFYSCDTYTVPHDASVENITYDRLSGVTAIDCNGFLDVKLDLDFAETSERISRLSLLPGVLSLKDGSSKICIGLGADLSRAPDREDSGGFSTSVKQMLNGPRGEALLKIISRILGPYEVDRNAEPFCVAGHPDEQINQEDPMVDLSSAMFSYQGFVALPLRRKISAPGQ